MERKRRVQIVTEVDSDLWEKFKEQAFAENLTTGQLLDKLIATYLETVQGHQEEDTISIPDISLEDMLLEQGSIVEEDQEEES
jgi:hypothetical protein